MSLGKDYRAKSFLTGREREVFELLVQDKTTKEIAEMLFISEKTVRNHISKEVLSARSRAPPATALDSACPTQTGDDRHYR